MSERKAINVCGWTFYRMAAPWLSMKVKAHYVRFLWCWAGIRKVGVRVQIGTIEYGIINRRRYKKAEREAMDESVEPVSDDQ